jgi:hypothetical protein
MKIHLHPAYPPTFLICAIPHAKIPPNAPANDAQLKNSEIRYCLSFLLYHILR